MDGLFLGSSLLFTKTERRTEAMSPAARSVSRRGVARSAGVSPAGHPATDDPDHCRRTRANTSTVSCATRQDPHECCNHG